MVVPIKFRRSFMNSSLKKTALATVIAGTFVADAIPVAEAHVLNVTVTCVPSRDPPQFDGCMLLVPVTVGRLPYQAWDGVVP